MWLDDLAGLSAAELEAVLEDFLGWDPRPPREAVARIAAEAVRRAHEAERLREALDGGLDCLPCFLVAAPRGVLP